MVSREENVWNMGPRLYPESNGYSPKSDTDSQIMKRGCGPTTIEPILACMCRRVSQHESDRSAPQLHRIVVEPRPSK
jgi:hypothetical protein